MELRNLTIKSKKRVLINDANLKFKEGMISHVLGKNGVGKTCLAKAAMGAFPYMGEIVINRDELCIIGSYTNIPSDLRVTDVIYMARKNFNLQSASSLFKTLNLNEDIYRTKIKHLSDGQRQKVKLLYFLSTNPRIVIFDEFTTALDKKSCLDIYAFLNMYSNENHATIINITHNLTDLEYLDGDYYLIEDESIEKYETKEDVINNYIKG